MVRKNFPLCSIEHRPLLGPLPKSRRKLQEKNRSFILVESRKAHSDGERERRSQKCRIPGQISEMLIETEEQVGFLQMSLDNLVNSQPFQKRVTNRRSLVISKPRILDECKVNHLKNKSQYWLLDAPGTHF